MPQSYPVGQAPWETNTATPPSYPVGQAPWETAGNTPAPDPATPISPAAAYTQRNPAIEQQEFGSATPTGIIPSLVHDTLGYGGLGGLVTRPIISAMTAGAEAPLAGSTSQLATLTNGLIQKLKTMSPSDPNYAKFSALVADNQRVMAGSNATMGNLEAAQSNPEQEAGTALNSATTLGAFAAAPISTATKGAAATLGRIGVGAGFGAASGAGYQMERGAGAADVGKGALFGGITGGTLAGAGELGSAIVDNFAGNTAESRLQTQTDRLKTLQNAFADSKTNPIETIASLGNTLRVNQGKVDVSLLTDKLDGLQSDVNDQARAIVGNMPGTVNTSDFQTQVENAIKNNASIRGSGGVTKALARVQSMFEDYAKTYGVEMPYSAVNEIRTSMNRFFDPETVDIERAVANTAREYLYDSATGSPELKALMARWGQLEDAQVFAKRLGGTAVKGGALGKYIADATASVVGATVAAPGGPLAQGAAAMTAPYVANKVMNVMQGNYFNPLLRAPAAGLSRFISGPVSQTGIDLASQAAARGASSLIPQPSGQ